ncbi:MAG: hypothetical protein AAGC79_12740 [Pseudomonadota bacterium]
MGQAKSETEDERASRLAEALRANLHRRKAQKLARAGQAGSDNDKTTQTPPEHEAE